MHHNTRMRVAWSLCKKNCLPAELHPSPPGQRAWHQQDNLGQQSLPRRCFHRHFLRFLVAVGCCPFCHLVKWLRYGECQCFWSPLPAQRAWWQIQQGAIHLRPATITVFERRKRGRRPQVKKLRQASRTPEPRRGKTKNSQYQQSTQNIN